MKKHFSTYTSIDEYNIDLQDDRFHCAECGQGEEVIFIHGTGLDCRMWAEQLQFFGRSYRAIAYDMRGFGFSTPLDGRPYSTVKDLCALMDALSIRRAHIVGLSRGGRTAINFAIEASDRVRSLTLGGANINGMPLSREFAELKDVTNLVAQKLGILPAKKVWMNSCLFASALRNETVALRLREMLDAYTPWHWLNPDTELKIKPEAYARLEDISASTIILLGEMDIPHFHKAAELLASRIPNARLEIIADAGHMHCMEQPNAFNEVLARFLTSVGSHNGSSDSMGANNN